VAHRPPQRSRPRRRTAAVGAFDTQVLLLLILNLAYALVNRQVSFAAHLYGAIAGGLVGGACALLARPARRDAAVAPRA